MKKLLSSFERLLTHNSASSIGRCQSRAMPLSLQVFFNTEKSMIKLRLIIEYN